ncbi:hypothetical protein [Rickettsia endosymbiont of Aspidapion aeneum]|uniref:hypothetical protein n=2 Tax=unclassified Rickettsia TaxID=114295 RepID=UPI00313C0987
MQYKFELSLQRMAMSAKAVSLWEQPHIKNKVREFFLHEYISSFREVKEANEEKWTNLTKEVLNQLKPRVLPKILDSELIYVVREVGAKIYNWYEYIRENLYNVDYAQQIYWTPYGSIDQVKIFKSFWLENSNLLTGNRGVDRLFRLACNYVLEEHVNNLWQQVPKKIQEGKFYTETIYGEYEFHLIAYWQCYLDGDLHYLIRYLRRASRDHDKLYDRNHSVEENMFRLSVSQGYEVAAKHFWGKLNEEEQERSLVSSAHIAIKKYGSYWDIGGYEREQYIEICTFLMNQIKEDRKEKLFEEEITTGIAGGEIFESSTEYRHNILKMFLFSWPWQEFFIPTLERMWSYLENSGYQKILYEIVCKISKDYKLGYVVENSKYQRILHEAWNKSPAHFKQEIDQNYYSSNIIGELLNIWDISSIKLIVNDQDTLQRRQELFIYIDKGYKKYTDLIKEDKYEILDQFIREILVSEEEQKSFKQKIDIWGYFIRGGRYHLADKLLDWQSSSVEERQSIKDKIDHISICHYFIKEDKYELADKLLDWQSSSAEERQSIKDKIDHISICHYFITEDKYELADKFLNWQFATEEEVRNCKNSFKSDKFSYDKIYKLWATFKEDIETARTQSLNFLNWFLDSEEEIAVFKKEKLVNEKLAEILCDSFIGYNRFEIIEDFLDWCLLSPEEIQQLKQVAVDRTIFRKCDYNIANDCLDIAERFVTWAFDEEDKRQEFIKEFMLSDDGIKSCNFLIKYASEVDPHHPKPTKEEKLEKFKKFIDFWIRPLENLDEVKNKLESYVTYYREEEKIENHKIFMNLLYTLEQNHDTMEVSYIGESSSTNM